MEERGTTPSRRETGSRSERRVPFRRKIDLLVVLPTLAMAALLTPVTVHEVTQARQWSDAAAALSKTRPVSLLIEDLSFERVRAQAALDGKPGPIRDYEAAVAVTDNQALQVAGAYGAQPPAAVSAALADIDSLSYVRTKTPYLKYSGLSATAYADAFGETQSLVNLNYGTVVSGLVDAIDLEGHSADGGPAATLEAELGALYSGDLAESQREAALAAFAATKSPSDAVLELNTAQQQSEVAQQRLAVVQNYPDASGIANSALAQMTDQPAYRDFADYQDQIGQALEPELGNIHTSDQAAQVATLLAQLRTPAKVAQTSQDFQTLTDQRASLEAQLTDRVIARAHRNSSDAVYTAVALVGSLAGVFVLMVGMSVVIRRSVVRPVVSLTTAATRVAAAAAADLERVTDEDLGAGGDLPDFEAIPVPTDDELGDLAQAFNKVQETALLMLERQVTIRRNTAEMFGNVGHRIHNLTGRQLSIIDQVERSETDPVLLDRLYRIDHLAVRLQRGADSLILLSGEREANISGTPMRLTDVVRSAVGRVEGYQRVVLIAEDDAMVAPSAVGDLTLMVAELVENAVAFSPASQRVEIAVGLSARGFVIEIVDRGMGMSPEQMAQENARLVRRERLDLAPTRVLGLFVVGRLSVRTGAAVELSATTGGGTTARVFVPGFLLAGPVSEAAGARGPRGDAAEAAATGTPAATPAPAADGIPSLPGSPAQGVQGVQGVQGRETWGRRPAAAAPQGYGAQAGPGAAAPASPSPAASPLPLGAEGLPRRVPGATQPGEAFSPPVSEAGFSGFGTPAEAGAGAAGSGYRSAQPTQPDQYSQVGQYAQPDQHSHPDQYSQPGQYSQPADPSAANAADGRFAAPAYQQPPTAGLDGSALRVSGFDALGRPGAPGQPGAPEVPGSRYSLGPLAPVAPEGLGRRRALPAGGEGSAPPHQPVPEPRRGTEMLPARRSQAASAPLQAPAPETTGMDRPYPPAPEPPRFATGTGQTVQYGQAAVPGAAPPSATPATPAPPAPSVQTSATTPQPADGALPRRVRKTPARPDWPSSQPSVVDGPAVPQDARAVRDALEAFEAGVEQANRDSAEQTQLPSRRQAARHAGPATPQRDGEDQ